MQFEKTVIERGGFRMRKMTLIIEYFVKTKAAELLGCIRCSFYGSVS